MFKHRNIPALYILASILFGIKTYIVYRFMFSLSIVNIFEELILFINPFVSAFLTFSIAVFFKANRQRIYILAMSVFGSIVLYLNLLYYRSFNDFITIPVLFQSSNAGDIGSSVWKLMDLSDVLLFLDVIILYFISRKGSQYKFAVFFSKKQQRKIFALALSFFIFNIVLSEIEYPKLFTRGFDREYIVKNVGVFDYHLYDIALNSKTKAQRVFADESEISKVKQYVDQHINVKSKQNEFTGIAKGKNIIFISAESLQDFVLNKKVNGKEITPFLNKLIKESYFFDNFYHQVGQGKTSDAEFIIENSLYALPRGAVFFTHAQNKYHAVPEIIKDYGYHSAVFHANNRSFWNREAMYPSIGYDQFYDEPYYKVTEENSIGWGLKDKPFFEQSMKYLNSLEEPFYAKLITLTNHYPFELDTSDAHIEKYDSDSETLNNYVQTVRYTDEAIEEFFQLLKDSGLYDHSIIIIYGDHYGISKYDNDAMSQFLGKKITPYENTQLQRVPLIIHIPGNNDNRTINEIAGQIDLKPTILNMLGIENKNDIEFGTDLFSRDRKSFEVFRDGSFVTDQYLYTEDQCYNRSTGEKLENKMCEPFKEDTQKELKYSDEIIYGDLFRFYSFDNN